MSRTDSAAICDRIDRDLAAGRARLDAGLVASYLAHLDGSVARAEMLSIDRFSMLHPDTLALLRACAIEARRGVLEIGSYIGGSTCAIAAGLRDSTAVPFLTIEVGGSYPDQPWLPTNDIIADWSANVASLGLSRYTALFQGWANDPAAVTALRDRLGPGGQVDLVFMDANGAFWPNIGPFADLFTDDCLFVMDDYHSVEGTQEKALNINFAVNHLRDRGGLVEFAPVRWSTWFGRLGPAFPALREEARGRGFSDLPLPGRVFMT